jgi:PIN domain nuclease of toxin-antitoxin system
MTVVLDASALLAYLKDEPGGDRVDEVLAESVMSSVFCRAIAPGRLSVWG